VSNTYFEFKQFKIYQDKSAFKVTTDACILGAYADTSNPDSICDIGTGTGVLALMLAQKFPGARIDAIEIDNLSAFKLKKMHVQVPGLKGSQFSTEVSKISQYLTKENII